MDPLGFKRILGPIVGSGNSDPLCFWKQAVFQVEMTCPSRGSVEMSGPLRGRVGGHIEVQNATPSANTRNT